MSCITEAPSAASGVMLNTTVSGGSGVMLAGNTSIQAVSSSMPTISSTKPAGNVPVTTNTIKNHPNKSSIAATSTSNSTVGNISTRERGGGGGADGVSSSYYVFVLTVIGAYVMKV